MTFEGNGKPVDVSRKTVALKNAACVADLRVRVICLVDVARIRLIGAVREIWRRHELGNSKLSLICAEIVTDRRIRHLTLIPGMLLPRPMRIIRYQVRIDGARQHIEIEAASEWRCGDAAVDVNTDLRGAAVAEIVLALVLVTVVVRIVAVV